MVAHPCPVRVAGQQKLELTGYRRRYKCQHGPRKSLTLMYRRGARTLRRNAARRRQRRGLLGGGQEFPLKKNTVTYQFGKKKKTLLLFSSHNNGTVTVHPRQRYMLDGCYTLLVA